MRGAALARLMRDIITVRSQTSVDAFGQVLTSTVTNVPARVVRSHVRSRTLRGEDFISTTQVATLHALREGDVLIIDGLEWPVKAVKSAASTRGGATLTEAHL